MKRIISDSARPYVKFFMLYGLFNLAISVMWNAYNTYFPIILQAGNPIFTNNPDGLAGFGLSAFAAGLIMSIDNLFATLLLPFIGAWGDKVTVRRELGGIFGIICLAAYLVLTYIPNMIPNEMSGNTQALMPLLLVTIVVIFIMMFCDQVGAQFRSGYQYNMVPKIHQSKMSSASVLFGGVGYVFASIMSWKLYEKNNSFPFLIGAAFMLITLVLYFFLSPPETEKNMRVLAERESAKAEGKKLRVNPLKVIAELYHKLDRNARVCIFLIFTTKILTNFGIYALQTYGSSFMLNALSIDPANLMIANLAFFGGNVLFAVPAGMMSDKLNKSKLFFAGATGLIIGGAGILLAGGSFAMVMVSSVILGCSASIMDVIMIPSVMNFAPEDGTSTGTLYSITVCVIVCISLLSVPLSGLVIDISKNYNCVPWMICIPALFALLPITLLSRHMKNTSN